MMVPTSTLGYLLHHGQIAIRTRKRKKREAEDVENSFVLDAHVSTVNTMSFVTVAWGGSDEVRP